MSDSRLKSNLTEEEAFTRILNHLLMLQGNKEHIIRGWGNTIQGYGYKQKEFDLFKDSAYRITTRIFRSKMNELLDKKLINQFDKSTKTKNGPLYSITPLGLVYLLQKIDRYSTNTVDRVFKLLSFFSEGDIETAEDVTERFTEKQILKAMKSLFYYSKIDFTTNKMVFAIDIPLQSLSAVRMLQVRIDSKKIYLDWAQEVWADMKKLPSIINEKELHMVISSSLENNLCFYLYQQIKAKKNTVKLSKSFQFTVHKIFELIEGTLDQDKEWMSKYHPDQIKKYV